MIEPEDLLQKLDGAVIVGHQFNEDGMHLELQDGRVVVVMALAEHVIGIALLNYGDRKLH